MRIVKKEGGSVGANATRQNRCCSSHQTAQPLEQPISTCSMLVLYILTANCDTRKTISAWPGYFLPSFPLEIVIYQTHDFK